eukprot:scaffold105875_cov60-Attheya_sp.AAC.1
MTRTTLEFTYIGFVREGGFVWTDGSDFTFTRWRVGQPNNDGGNEDCTTTYHSNPDVVDHWVDRPCYREYPGVYKLPISSLCTAIAGYTCYEGDSTGCSSSLNCKTELTTC